MNDLDAMPDRNFEGDAVDLTYSTGPWVNDGETVDVVNSEGDGEVSFNGETVSLTPELAYRTLQKTEWDELSIDQRCDLVRMAAREYNVTDLATFTPVSQPTLSDYNSASGKHGDSGTIAASQSPDGPKGFNSDDVAEMREMLLDGGSVNDVAKAFDCTSRSVRRQVKGKTTVECAEPNAVEWSGSEWVEQDAESEGVTGRPEQILDENSTAADLETDTDDVDEPSVAHDPTTAPTEPRRADPFTETETDKRGYDKNTLIGVGLVAGVVGYLYRYLRE